MFKQARVIVRNDFRLLIREKLFLLILALFLVMVGLASLIGWITIHTTSQVYATSVQFLHTHGTAQVVSNPVGSPSPLSLQRNLIIYIFLIGSLLAIIIGCSIAMRDRVAGVTRLIFSKPLTKTTYIAARIMTLAVSIAIILTISFLLSLFFSYLFKSEHLAIGQVGKLAVFFGLSWIYLLIFALVGLLSGLIAGSQEFSLLIPVIVWVVFSFVMPELVLAIDPTASLNPVNIASTPVPAGGFFSFTQHIFGPLSISQNYKDISGQLFEVNTSAPIAQIVTNNLAKILWIFGAFVAALTASIFTGLRYKPTEDLLNE